MTDDPAIEPIPDEFYIMLDAPVEICWARLLAAGKSGSERYHTIEDLTYDRQRFLEVVPTLHNSAVIDPSSSPEVVFEAGLAALQERSATA